MNPTRAHTSPWQPMAQFRARGDYCSEIMFMGNTDKFRFFCPYFLSEMLFLSRCLEGFCREEAPLWARGSLSFGLSGSGLTVDLQVQL